ncbi:MAG TPA: hypothetical protein GXZ90_01125 [Clostridiales bacterium]|nr:hypothetical protein [Clostridiales bacterium]
MISLLDFREKIKDLYQRYDLYIKIFAKFIFAFFVFVTIKEEIGFDPRLNKLIIILALSIISSIMPSSIVVLLAMLVSVLNVFYISNILSVLILLIVLILYFLFARYTPKYGYLLLLVPLLFTFNVAYLVPILLGVIATPITIIPTSCGIIIYYLLKVVKNAVNIQTNIGVEDVLQLYTYVIDKLINNKHLIMTIVIFAMITIITYYIRRMKFDYSHEISIVAGGLTCLFGFLISDLTLDVSDQIFGMILGTVISMVIVLIFNFFNFTLDYSGKEYVQFEDDSYYYYVKAVPKLMISAPEKNVKIFIDRVRDDSTDDIDESLNDNKEDDFNDIDDKLRNIYLDDEDDE